MSRTARVAQQDQRPADRVDRDVDAAVVVEVGGSETTTVRAERCDEVRRGERSVVVLGEDLYWAGVLREVRDRDRAARQNEVEPAVIVQVGPGVAPAGTAADHGRERRAGVGERLPGAAVDGVRLVARVADEEVLQTIAVGVGLGDPHSGVPVCDLSLLRLIDEPEPERPARDVDVEPVRILVVRDVEIHAPVVVQVGEDGAQAVVERRAVEANPGAHLTEVLAALVEEQQVAHAFGVRREALDRPGDRMLHVGVAPDEEVEPAVAVHVRDRGAGVPAERDDASLPRAFGERAIAVVPEQHVARSGGDVEVGLAVAVQVAGDAALAAHLHPCAGSSRDVREPAVVVAEERAAGQAPVIVPGGQIRVRVRVDGEQVEPAVVVVVEPAEPRAHHRCGVVRDAVAEGALAEVQPDLVRNAHQAVPR